MLSASASMSPVSDPQQSRLTAVGKRHGLPQDNQRLRLNKLADGKTSKIRILTLNVGSVTGRGREIAAVLKERNIYIAGVQEAKFFYVKGSHRPRPLTRFECFEYAKRRGHGRRVHAPD